jgi:hypothetical protein
MNKLGSNRKRFGAIWKAGFSGFAFVAGVVLADQDGYTLTAPNGIAFSEFRGYDQCRTSL